MPAESGIVELEEAAALGWQAVESRWLGRWLLRASEGFTGRANSVLPLGAPDRPVEAAVDLVESWYAERSLPPRFQLPMPVAAEVDAVLSRRGWAAYNPTLVMTTRLDAVPRHQPAVRLAAEPSAQWLAGYHYRGGAELPPVARRLMLSARNRVFAAVHRDGAAVAIGRAAADAGWAGITAMEVAPAYRRRGLGRAVLVALCGWAGGVGVDRVYLQVAEDNPNARALYDGAGFRVHHRYHYRVGPSSVPT